ncbi:NADH-quinone oxidoreductase subunit H [bacterium]|nr:NADH-quinone oxidoreductase subunit H [bacterium]
MFNMVLDIIIMLIAPFLMLGIIKKTKAFLSGRKGVKLIQPFFDFIKLLKKDCVYSSTTSWIFKAYPIVYLATVVFAALIVPYSVGKPILEIPFTFIFFAYILSFGKFFSLLAALDTGSSFEGMGASREACFSTIIEPAFFVMMGSIAVLSNNYTFDSIKLIFNNSGIYGYIIVALSVLTLFIMMLIESCRVPVDDPTTHLELTMIHEVMILDNSGPDLAFINWASMLKIYVFEALIATFILPAGINNFISTILFLTIITLISVLVGVIESIMARFRMTHVFEFIFIMTITSLLILALVTYKIYGN